MPKMHTPSTDFLKRLVAAWEALPGGKRQPVNAVERWLIEDMAPVINEARRALAAASPADTE